MIETICSLEDNQISDERVQPDKSQQPDSQFGLELDGNQSGKSPSMKRPSIDTVRRLIDWFSKEMDEMV